MFTDSAQRSLVLAFEAVSTFTTSGLSVNLTPHLSPGGKPVLVVLMFLGRVGFLSLLLAFRPARSSAVQVPETHELTMG